MGRVPAGDHHPRDLLVPRREPLGVVSRRLTCRECAAEARAGHRPCSLRIWSAACSTGDEAFTAACCIAACLPNFQQWQVRILGTDIGVGAVTQAKAPGSPSGRCGSCRSAYRERFFSEDAQREPVAGASDADARWSLSGSITCWIRSASGRSTWCFSRMC